VQSAVKIKCIKILIAVSEECVVMQFQETLKPNYNSVDLTEVELVDMDGGPRENNTFLLDVSVTQHV
jgi:hypothetical protein